MKTSRRKSTGVSAPPRAAKKTDRRARRTPDAATWPDLPQAADSETYRPELVARLEQAVREGRYRPDPKAIAAAMIDRMDEI